MTEPHVGQLPEHAFRIHEESLTPQRREELKNMLVAMRASSADFYRSAVRVGCHPWIEFTGFLNEYIKIAEQNLAAGIDFAECNAHSGKPLQIQPFEAAYIGEKLNCIYGDALAGQHWNEFVKHVKG